MIWYKKKKKRREERTAKDKCGLTMRASPEAWPKEICLLKGNWNLADSLGGIFSQFKRDVYNMYMETIGSKLRYIEIHDKTGFTPVNRQINLHHGLSPEDHDFIFTLLVLFDAAICLNTIFLELLWVSVHKLP